MDDEERKHLREGFDREVLHPVQELLGNKRIQVPRGPTWFVEANEGAVIPCVEVGAKALCRNLQEDLAASPTFLVCLAYWLEELTQTRVRCRVRVTGTPAAADPGALRHWRRSMVVLSELQQALGDRLEVDVQAHPYEPQWNASELLWPRDPVLNVASKVRGADSGPRDRAEHALELFLYGTDAAWSSFPVPIGTRGRQLPVGLFHGSVSKSTQWTPAGGSQVDLWALSQDGTTLHLFELKAKGNMPLGILPEALYYARLLHLVRVGWPDRRTISDNSELASLLRAETSSTRGVSMWLSAPRIHPLLEPRAIARQGTTVRATALEWLHDSMSADGVQLGVAPFEWDRSLRRFRWRREDFWPELRVR